MMKEQKAGGKGTEIVTTALNAVCSITIGLICFGILASIPKIASEFGSQIPEFLKFPATIMSTALTVCLFISSQRKSKNKK